MTPNRVMSTRSSSAVSVCPSCLNSSSSRPRLVGSASALKTSFTFRIIRDHPVTCQAMTTRRCPVLSAEQREQVPARLT